MYHIHTDTAPVKQENTFQPSFQTQPMEGHHPHRRDDDDDDVEYAAFTVPWLRQQQVESLVDSVSSKASFGSPQSAKSDGRISLDCSATYSHLPSPRGRYPRRNSHDASSMAEASLVSSCLVGEGIPMGLMSPSSQISVESDDLEHQQVPSTRQTKKTVSFIDLEQGTQERRGLQLVKEWSCKLNQELTRVGYMTSNELVHIARLSTQTAVKTAQRVRELRPAPLSPLPEEQYDLEYLKQTHKEKMGSMSNIDHEDHFDFALVLADQAVYAFWAEHLDFRTEQLGYMPTSVSPTSTQGTDDSDEGDVIDARPFVTPSSAGVRQRHNSKKTPGQFTPSTSKRPSMQQPLHSGGIFNQSFTLDDSVPRIVKPRLSLFEKAIGIFSPRMSLTAGGTSRRNIFAEESTLETPPMSVMTARRRWGNRGLTTTGEKSSPGDLSSPPIRSLGRISSVRKRPSVSLSTIASRTSPITKEDEDEKPLSKRQRKNPNSIEIEDIPTQIIPRGIAVRTNGMMQFLSALKKGIVLRRHRPGAEAIFLMIMSSDGGDTIKYDFIDSDEAMLAFREQRIKFNKTKKTNVDMSRNLCKAWSHQEEDEQLHAFSIPDFVAAKQYRKRHEHKTGIKKTVTDAATKIKNSGIIKASDIIAVHPARLKDPRSSTGALGVGSLRKSKSEYYGQHTFSIILRSNPAIFKKNNTKMAMASERWYAGDGRDIEFKSVDFEAATEGEYWLLFRGFLLLHRDVASGRFAAQRAAGFGNKYNQEEESERYNILQKDVYHEPPTVGWVEKMVAKARKIDMSYMVGRAGPGATPPPSDYFLGFKSPGTQIWSRLRQAGLETSRVYAIDTRRVLIKVRCPDDRLLDVAEVLRIQLKTRNGAFARFRENAIAQFQPICDDADVDPKAILEGAALFRSSQRQTVIDFIIRSRIRDSGAELGQSTELGHMIQCRVPLHVHKTLDILYDGWFYFWRRSNWIGRDGRSLTVGIELTKEASKRSINDEESQNLLGSKIDHVPPNFLHRFFVGALHQPLDSIELYFGEKIAFYFAWLQHCANHLVFLSIAGVIVTICQLKYGWDNPTRPLFSVVVMIWSFFVLVNWRKRCNFLAHRWGTKDLKEKETTRPQFHGEYMKDKVTQEWVVVYPRWKRYLKYLISFPLTLIFTFGTLHLILLVHANRDLLLYKYYQTPVSGSEKFDLSFSLRAIGQKKTLQDVPIKKEDLRNPAFWFIAAGLPAALGLCLPLLNLILMRISVALTDFENYRTESEYRTHLIIKVFSFRFVCYFATLYYYAFLSVSNEQPIENGMLRIATSVFIYITVTHWWGLFLQIQFPRIIYRWRMKRQKKRLREELMFVEMEESQYADMSPAEAMNEDIIAQKVRLINKRLLLDQAQDHLWEEVLMPEHDSFPEYIQAVIQFAFVTCFSVVLPITPLICLMNHLLSMRFDAYKVCRTRKRPLAVKTGGIGVWEHVLHIVTVIAVLTNCFLVGFTSSQLNWINGETNDGKASEGKTIQLIVFVVAWEHIMLLIKYIMSTSISTLPRAVKDDLKKEQHRMESMRNSNMRAKNNRRSKYRKDSDSDSCFSSTGPSFRTDVSRRASNGGGLCTIPSEDTENSSPESRNKGLAKKSGTEGSNAHTTERSPLQPITSNNSHHSCNTGSSNFSSRISVPSPCQLEIDAETTVGDKDEPEKERDFDSPLTMFLPRVTVQTPTALKQESNAVEDLFGGSGLDEDESLATREEASGLSLKYTDREEANAAERIACRLQDLEKRISERTKGI